MATPLDDFTFNGDDLRQVHRFVINSLAFYMNKTIRTENLNLALVHETILEPAKFTGASKSFVPDGCTRVTCKLFKAALRAVTSFTEIQNGIGEGGWDPIHQAQCDYVAFYSAEAVGLLSLFFRVANHPFSASASSRCILLSLIPRWHCRPLHDRLWCRSCGSFHFSTLDGLYLSRWKATSRRPTLRDRQGSDDFERMHY